MTRWAYLDDIERKRLEEYDRRLVCLMGRRSLFRNNARIERAIARLHRRMDVFILQLADKYVHMP